MSSIFHEHLNKIETNAELEDSLKIRPTVYLQKKDYLNYFFTCKANWFKSQKELDLIFKLNEEDADDEEEENDEYSSHIFLEEQSKDIEFEVNNDMAIEAVEGRIVEHYFKKELQKKENFTHHDLLNYSTFNAYKKTLHLINEVLTSPSKSKKIIYEATFIVDNLIVKIDALMISGLSLMIYECKSSTKPKNPQHLVDIQYQFQIIKKWIEKMGLNFWIQDTFLVLCSSELIKKNKIVQFNFKNKIEIDKKDVNIIDLIQSNNNKFNFEEQIFWKTINELQNAKKQLLPTIQEVASSMNADFYKKHCSKCRVKKNCMKNYLQPLYPHLTFHGNIWKSKPSIEGLDSAFNLFKNNFDENKVFSDILSYFKSTSGKTKTYRNDQFTQYTTGGKVVAEYLNAKNENVEIKILDDENFEKEYRKYENFDNLVWFDFETISSALVSQDFSKSYTQKVFQCSIYKNKENINLVEDPLKTDLDFYKKIIDEIYSENENAKYIVFYAPFERGRLKEIKAYFEQMNVEKTYIDKINKIIDEDNLLDLANFFKSSGKTMKDEFDEKKKIANVYISYVPLLKGYYSIKKVIDRIEKKYHYLLDEANVVSYENSLNIKNGKQATDIAKKRFLYQYKDLIKGIFNNLDINTYFLDEHKWNSYIKDLILYCQNDVMAMVASYFYIRQEMKKYIS